MLPALGSYVVNAVGEGALEAAGIDEPSMGNLQLAPQNRQPRMTRCAASSTVPLCASELAEREE